MDALHEDTEKLSLLFFAARRSRFHDGHPFSHHQPHRLGPQHPDPPNQAKHLGPLCGHWQPGRQLRRSVAGNSKSHSCHRLGLFLLTRGTFARAGSGFSSKPTTPTGPAPFMPPMGSPSRPPPSPQHGAFPSWQPGAATGAGWQPQGQSPVPQPKPSPSHGPMPHTSPQNRPNYNVSFSAMGGGSPSAGGKAQAGVGESEVGELHLIRRQQ